jgi:magnesium chelatase subunit D
MERAKQALLLLAVDPGLKAVLIAGPPGTGKSVLARSFAGEEVVEVPLGVTEDGLVGSLDLERTLRTGRRHMASGLLARAHGRFLYVEGINLLDRSLACRIAGALDEGVVHFERDGISGVYPSDFRLLGTYAPGPGEVDARLLDCVGLHVTEDGGLTCEERVEVMRRADRDPVEFAERFTPPRRHVGKVRVRSEDQQRLVSAALQFGIASHRADIFAIRAARASAALAGRESVDESDLAAAVELVLLPRARTVPAAMEPQRSQTEHKDSGAAGEEEVKQALDCRLPEGLLKGRTAVADLQRGRYVRSSLKSRKVSLGATLRAAAPFQLLRGTHEGIKIRASDLRFKEFKRKAGTMIIFAVDASGSMAHNRISYAKGALIRLLREAYLHRDRVALVSFQGDRAEVLLPPSRSVELAKRALDALPVGGGTPLAAGLIASLELARRAEQAGDRQTILVIFTDGRANVSAKPQESIWSELENVCLAVRSEGVTPIVIDTSRRGIGDGGAERLACLLGGRRVCLPQPDAGAVCDAVAAARIP